MSKFCCLLAKSSKTPKNPRGEETLRGHTAMVTASAEAMLAERAEASLLAAGLVVPVERLCKIVLLAALSHDLGKCSEHFQMMVREKRKEPQLMRHEALSLYLCWPGQPLSSWLSQALPEEDYKISIIAGAAHHRKFWEKTFADPASGAGTSLLLHIHHPDFHDTLKLLALKLKLPTPPVFTAPEEVRVSAFSHPRRLFQRWQEEADNLLKSPEQRKLLAVVKALVISSDIAGSALPKDQKHPKRWIPQQLSQRATSVATREVVDIRLAGKSLRPFQQKVADSKSPVTFVLGGCGSGKTVGAYLWFAQQYAGRQLWVTYPTTGTATEGFRGYLHNSNHDMPIKGRLEHSRALVDIDIFSLQGDSEPSREQDRLDSLRAWGSEAIVCTVDTVLGIIQNQRKALYAWPGLCHSAVVFDEIHAYDDELFGALLRFLEALPGIPALLMTASLPASRLEAVRSLIQRVHNQPLAEIEGPRDLEELKRYQLQSSTEEEAWEIARAHITEGKKVLWVSNTVDRCIAVGARAASFAPSAIYHSRFKYSDRVRRHGDVIDAFGKDSPFFASTTQVAEMSLDLSADLLVTDLAPIPALIQRLGRLNRRSTPESPQPIKRCLILPFDGMPYDDPQSDLPGAKQWCESLAGRDISQRDLVDAWAQPIRPISTITSSWLDGVFVTMPRSLREPTPGISVLMKCDEPDVKAKRVNATEVVIPMTQPPAAITSKFGKDETWPKEQFIPVAPNGAIKYDPYQGAQWNK